MTKTNNCLLMLILGIALVACSTLELESPNNVDLSGYWVLDPALSQDVIFPIPKLGGRDVSGGGKGSKSRRGGRSGKGSGPSSSGNSHQALKKPEAAIAIKMTIEQVSDSMGVRYDSGNYRDVEWGVTKNRNNTVDAGWRGDSLIIKTKSRRGSITETYRVNQDTTVLTVQFHVDGNDYTRVYRLQKVLSSSK